MNAGRLIGFAMLVATPLLGAGPQASPQATITSDELVLKKNGETTIFKGHVVLKQDPYEVRADRMTRMMATGKVRATGRVVGTWVSPKKDRVRVESDEAEYDPNQHTVEIWGKKQVDIYLFGEKDQAVFHGDRGWIFTQTPGKARLIGNVTGHVTPG